tara:strand:+ start:218 stop:424 length:207 start_codon:yes stop_codon:yes gene_type:complete
MKYFKRFASLKAAKSWGRSNMARGFIVAKVPPGRTSNGYTNTKKSVHWVIRFSPDDISLFSTWSPDEG